MRTRRTELSGWQDPENESCESATDRPPENALEAAAARAVRVGELRRALAAGTYRPDAGKVAQALLKSLTRLALFGDDH
ncbi:MAG: flagellar biosynthesis anti-sigma factor FlgM [Candidatus Binatia bacterium]|nr:flagellar biosynthesis anti-sigma factor FlgM [Candidatus Binatia bacterium]